MQVDNLKSQNKRDRLFDVNLENMDLPSFRPHVASPLSQNSAHGQKASWRQPLIEPLPVREEGINSFHWESNLTLEQSKNEFVPLLSCKAIISLGCEGNKKTKHIIYFLCL